MKKFLIILSSVIVVLLVISLVYLNVGQYSSLDENSQTFDQNFVKMDGYYEHEIGSDVGIIMYQGAKVDPKSYDYLKDINANVYVSDFAFGIAFFNPDLASDIIEQNKDIKEWYFIGHSLGGSVVYDQALKSNSVKEVFMLGSYPIKKTDTSSFETTAFFATNDGLIQDYEDKKLLYPSSTEFVLLEGGNHSQYGNYGFQKGDMKSTISSNEQQKIIVDTINSSISKE